MGLPLFHFYQRVAKSVVKLAKTNAFHVLFLLNCIKV